MPGEDKSAPISWYRAPVDPEILKELHKRSDFLGFCQTLGYLGLLASLCVGALYGAGRWPWYVVVLLIYAYGTVNAFQSAAVHELGHGTVFRTKWLNSFFVRICGFLSWYNFEVFNVSHARHHRYTLHPPDDLEVVLPAKLMVKHFFQGGFLSPFDPYGYIKETIRIARGKFQGPWELAIFPESSPEKRKPPIRWAWTMLIGHSLVIIVSIYFHLWLLPLMVTFARGYGRWLFFLTNNTQHIGLADNVPDFRLCCRTFLVNPVVEFLYWHMNYHTDHHMYAAVPCYKLGKLHRLIAYDFPPCTVGLIATWKQIGEILERQKDDPKYQYIAPLPNAPVTAPAYASVVSNK